MQKAAILILNWKGIEDTKNCLKSIKKSGEIFDIYILDNGGEEFDKLKKLSDKQIFILKTEKNLGFPGGINFLLKKLIKKYDYFYLLNNDTEVEKNFASECLNCFSKKIGFVASKMCKFDNRYILDNDGHDFLNCGDFIPKNRNKLAKLSNKKKFIISGCMGGLCISKKCLEDTGYLEEDFFLSSEDSEWTFRAFLYGWKGFYTPKSIIYHKEHSSQKKIKDKKLIIKQQQNQFFAYIYNAPILLIILNIPWILLRDIFFIVISLCLFRLKQVKFFLISRWYIIKSWKKILLKRKQRSKKQKISTFKILKFQKNFIPIYFIYLINILKKIIKS